MHTRCVGSGIAIGRTADLDHRQHHECTSCGRMVGAHTDGHDVRLNQHTSSTVHEFRARDRGLTVEHYAGYGDPLGNLLYLDVAGTHVRLTATESIGLAIDALVIAAQEIPEARVALDALDAWRQVQDALGIPTLQVVR